MRNSSATSRTFLDVTPDGEVQNAPFETTVSDRWIDSHPAVKLESGVVHAGWGPGAVEYEVLNSEFGYYYLQKIA